VVDRLDQLNLSLRQQTEVRFFGLALTPNARYITKEVGYTMPREYCETYFRSAGYRVRMRTKAEQAHVTYPKGSIEWILMVDHGVMRPHVGGYMAGAGIFQGGLPLRPPVRRSPVPTEWGTLRQRPDASHTTLPQDRGQIQCSSATKFISLSHCRPSPWLVVKQSDNTRRDEKRRMTGWLECVISCLVAVHGYLARLHGLDIELLGRSSFGLWSQMLLQSPTQFESALVY